MSRQETATIRAIQRANELLGVPDFQDYQRCREQIRGFLDTYGRSKVSELSEPEAEAFLARFGNPPPKRPKSRAPVTKPVSPLIESLEEIREAVFGHVGSEPNVYADYDKLCELSGKMRDIISTVTHNEKLLITEKENRKLWEKAATAAQERAENAERANVSKDDEINRFRRERDVWIETVGEIAAVIPPSQVIQVTATAHDMIGYFKTLLSENAKLKEKIALLEAKA